MPSKHVVGLYTTVASEALCREVGKLKLAPRETLSEDDVRKQLARPAFRRIGEPSVRYLPYGELGGNRESMARFGEGLEAIDAIARALV